MHIRLTYFDFPFWRAEVSRLALHIGGIPFEDIRPSRDEFRRMKAEGSLPYGQLPILEVDGVIIAQSAAIARFCGKLSDLYPKDPLSGARVDELLATANQITYSVSSSMRERDPELRAAHREKLATKTLPLWLAQLEKRLISDNPGPFFTGAVMSVGDLAIWRLLSWLAGGILDGIPTTLLDPYPALCQHLETVGQREDVRTWMLRYDSPKD